MLMTDSDIYIFFFSGVVPKSQSEMAQNRKMLGPKYDNGGVRLVRSDGAAQSAPPGNDPQEREGERVCSTLVAR